MPLARISQTILFFVHIPKTGGTSIERYLALKGPLALRHGRRMGWSATVAQHMDSRIHSKLVPREFYDRSFAVFRDPVSRIASEYRYRIGNRQNPKPFDDWVKAAFDRYGRDEYTFDNHIKPQASYVLPDTKLFSFEDGLSQVYDWIDKTTQTNPADHGIWENRSEKMEVAVSAAIRREIENFYVSDYRMIEKWKKARNRDS